jgi:hypothetical protein
MTDHSSTAPPTIAQVIGTLDEMAAAARAGDGSRYRAAVQVALGQDISREQMVDAYQWGRRDIGPAAFDWQGEE